MADLLADLPNDPLAGIPDAPAGGLSAGPDDAVIRRAPEKTPWESVRDGITGFLERFPNRSADSAWDEKRARAGAILDIKNDYASRGVFLSTKDVDENFDKLTGGKGVMGREALPGVQAMRLREPTTRELIEGGMGALLAAGLYSAPASTLLGVAGFEALGAVKRGALEGAYLAYNKSLEALGLPVEPYEYGKHGELSSFLPEGASPEAKGTLDLLEFAAQAKGAHALTPLGRSILETATQKVLTDYKMPESVFISPEKIRSIFQTGEGLSPEEMDLVKGLGLTSKQYREAMDLGLTIEVPASKVVTVADRPWYARAKRFFGLTPYEAMTGREFATAPEGRRPVSGELPEGQGVGAAEAAPPEAGKAAQSPAAAQQTRVEPTAAEIEMTPLAPAGGGAAAPDPSTSIDAEKNLSIGREAMSRVIQDKTDALDAMHRQEIGGISFYWGNPGTPEKAFKDGSGISHIIARRTHEGQDGAAVAGQMVDVLANGKFGKPYGPENGTRVNVTNDGHTAVLSLYRFGDKKTWLLTGWKDEVSGAPGESSNRQGYARQSSGSRTDVGAEASSGEKITHPELDGKGGAAGELPSSSDMAYMAMQNEAQARALESAMKRRKKDQGTKHSNIPWSQDAETETLGNFLATVDRLGGLDRAYMEENYPPTVVAALDAGGLLKKGGSLPHDAAGFLGYQDESAMFDAIHGALSGKLTTLEAMRASTELGDNIARYSLDSEEYAAYLAEQERILGRMMNGPRTNKKPRILGQDNPTVGELQVDEQAALEAALKRAEQAARKAFREGNIEGALVEKELQQALVRRAIARRRMREEVAEIKGALEKAAGNTAIPLDYQEQVADLLDAVDVRRAPKTQRRLDSLADFLARQEAAGEDTSYIPVDLIERMKRRPLNDFDIQELRDLRDSVESIVHLGTLKNKLLTSKSKRDFNSTVNDLVGAIHEKARLDAEDLAKMNPDEPLLREARPGLFGFARGAFSDGAAKLQDPEFIIRALDGRVQDGPAHEALWWPTKHANDAELLRREQHRAAMERILAPVFDEGRQFFSKRYSIPGVRGLFTKEEAVSVALNSQRPLNVRHLVNGNKFKPEEIKAIVDWLEPQYRDMVSQVWDYNESLFEAINENHIALTGKRLEKTPGRYYPAAINWKMSRRGDMMLERMANTQDGFEPQFFVRPGTSASFRQEATGGDQPLRLDIDVWVKHLMDEATDTTRTVVARDMAKLLLDQRVKQAIITARGEGEYRALIDWLKDQRDLSKTPQDRMMRLGEVVRNNMTSSQLALNIVNILQQPFSLLNVFSEPGVGPADVAKVLGEYIADPRGMTRFATSRSVELRARIDTKTMEADRDMAALAKSANALDRGIIDAARRAAFLPTIIMDQVATVPTWLIGYRKGLLDYAGNEAKAIDYADSLMARTQSSGDKLHRPAVMNKQGWTRFFTMFMTWQMNYTNQFRENFGRAWDNPNSANVVQLAKYLFWVVVMQQVLQSPLKYGRMPDKKELARDIVTAPVQGVPFLKDFVNPLSRVFTGSYAMPYRVSPMERIPQAAIDLAGAMTSKSQDARARAWLDAIELGSYASGLPTRIGTNVAHGIETKRRTGKGNALNLIVPRQQEPRK